MTQLKFDNVNLAFQAHNHILKQISFAINPSDFLIIVGSNGSGKSSLLKLIDRTYQQTSGKILLESKLLSEIPHKKINRQIRMLSQTLNQVIIYEMTLFENFKLWQSYQGATILSRSEFEDYLKKFHPKLSQKLDVALYKLSGGERQIFALSLILLDPPKLLLLDEHTSALDPKRAKMIMQLTNEKILEHDLTAVMVTHNLQDALTYGNKLIVLHQGEIKQFFDEKQKKHLDLEKFLTLYQE